MIRAFKSTIVVLILAVGVAASAAAGPLEDGANAGKRGDYATAMRLLRPLADEGNAQAQYNVGEMYENGWGRPHDNSAAAHWYQKAADQGYATAQMALGHMYNFGFGVPQTSRLQCAGIEKPPTRAMPWLKISLEACTRAVRVSQRTLPLQ
jgi:TPR repeat protein